MVGEAVGAVSSKFAPASLYLAFGAVSIGLYFILPPDVQSILFILIAVSASVAMIAGARLHLNSNRLPWYLFAAGQLAFAIGDAIFGYYEIVFGREPPFPSIADGPYLAAYPLIILGVFLLVRRLAVVEGHFALIDAGIVALGFGLVQWVFMIEPEIHEAGASAIERVVLIAYPAADALLLGALARFFLAPAWRTPAYFYVMVSIVLLLMADEAYAANPEGYLAGSWVDALWLGSYILWGTGALHPSMRGLSASTEGDRDLSWTRLALMAAALLAAPTILVIEVARENRLEGFVVFAAAAVLAILVLARGFGIDAYVAQRERIIRVLRNAVRGLSAPILDIRDEILIVPIVGKINTERAQFLTEKLSASIRRSPARIVVIDMTNVGVTDRMTGRQLLGITEAPGLAGVAFIIAGLPEELAHQLGESAPSRSNLDVEQDLGAGLALAEELLGYRGVKA